MGNDNTMDYKSVSKRFENDLESIFRGINSALVAREDSRSFGSMIEETISNNWKRICKANNYAPLDRPGKRSIYDFACIIDNRFFGFDIKTKDLDSEKYSDGGVCAVGNLLKFMANDNGVLMIIEFGHTRSSNDLKTRDMKYIRVAPFHILPRDSYRIENLGTGQIRLNYSLNQIWDKLSWKRTYHDFFVFFCDLTMKHYSRVMADADKRLKSIIEFKNIDFKTFKFIK